MRAKLFAWSRRHRDFATCVYLIDTVSRQNHHYHDKAVINTTAIKGMSDAREEKKTRIARDLSILNRHLIRRKSVVVTRS